MSKSNRIDRERFLILYNQGLNDSQIAKQMGRNHVGIKQVRESLKLPSNFKYKRKFDTNKFLVLYEEGLNDIEISKLLNCSSSSIQEYRTSLNLVTKARKYDDILISHQQEQIIIGTLLGDAHIRKDWANAQMDITHCLKQEEYCKWKVSFFNNLFLDIKYRNQKDKRTKKTYYKVCALSKSHPCLNPYHNLFYKNKKKIVPKELLYRLEGLGLAVWFMDDGSKHHNGYYLATNGFSDADRNLIVKFFEEKFNIKAKIHSKQVIYIGSKYKETFKLLISPYIIDSMKYKL